MIPDIYFNNVSMLSSGWIRESVSFPVPKVQTNTVVVPGRSVPLRYTESIGDVSYNPREFEFILTMKGSRKEFNKAVSNLVNHFVGVTKVILSEELDFYMQGTLEYENTYDALLSKGQVIVGCTDADAYRYHVNETVVKVEKSEEVKLFNDYMPVVPVIATTAETTLSWCVGKDIFTKTVSKGVWEFTELELKYGENNVKIESEGVTTFTYREGRL